MRQQKKYKRLSENVMFNLSNCDWKLKLAEPRTELLNQQRGVDRSVNILKKVCERKPTDGVLNGLIEAMKS